MSLTGFLERSKEARILLRDHFSLSEKPIFPKLLAPPQTTNYAVIGQAFDYLLRFYMQRCNPHAPLKSAWVANLIQASLSGEDEEIQERRKMEETALIYLTSAHTHHAQYLEDGIVTDELLGSCIDLAIIDGIVRAGELRGSLGERDKRDLADLRKLLALVPSTPFLDGGEPCLLNPIFSFPSGADCDLLINDTLIEIKTTKFPVFRQEHYQQLLGYYLCNLNKMRYEIKRLGIYYSRFGYFWSIAIDAIASHETFLTVLQLWNGLIQQYYELKPVETSQHSTDDLVAQVDKLKSLTSYISWLAQLSNADLALWRAHPTAQYYALGTIEAEGKRRLSKTQIRQKS